MKRQLAFSLIELMVVIAIIGIITVIGIPIYKTNVTKTNVSEMVNKLGSFKLEMMDGYLASGIWPTTINGATAGTTNTDSFFSDASNFRYNAAGNQAWVGYQLSSTYGAGWIFLFLQADTGGVFESHCGAMSTDCTWGSCNSLSYFPSGCDEANLSTTYSISSI